MTSSCRFCTSGGDLPSSLRLAEFLTLHLMGKRISDVEIIYATRSAKGSVEFSQLSETAEYHELLTAVFLACASGQITLTGRKVQLPRLSIEPTTSPIPSDYFCWPPKYKMGEGPYGLGELDWDRYDISWASRPEWNISYVEVEISSIDALTLHKKLCEYAANGEAANNAKRGPKGLGKVIKSAAIDAFPPDGKMPPGMLVKTYRDEISKRLPDGVPVPSDRTFQNHGF